MFVKRVDPVKLKMILVYTIIRTAKRLQVVIHVDIKQVFNILFTILTFELNSKGAVIL